jgi:hypothetical protein
MNFLTSAIVAVENHVVKWIQVPIAEQEERDSNDKEETKDKNNDKDLEIARLEAIIVR